MLLISDITSPIWAGASLFICLPSSSDESSAQTLCSMATVHTQTGSALGRHLALAQAGYRAHSLSGTIEPGRMSLHKGGGESSALRFHLCCHLQCAHQASAELPDDLTKTPAFTLVWGNQGCPQIPLTQPACNHYPHTLVSTCIEALGDTLHLLLPWVLPYTDRAALHRALEQQRFTMADSLHSELPDLRDALLQPDCMYCQPPAVDKDFGAWSHAHLTTTSMGGRSCGLPKRGRMLRKRCLMRARSSARITRRVSNPDSSP